MRAPAALVVAFFAIFAGGSLRVATFDAAELPFDRVAREHFDAFTVRHETAPPSLAPLVVRVRLVGDGTEADVEPARAWLRAHANVRLHAVPPEESGAPLFLTGADLMATSGRSTLGATVPRGMAVEVGDPTRAPCVIAHEVLHFLGLRHVVDEENLMHPSCTASRLATSGLDPDQRDALARIDRIVAATPRGWEEWAFREGPMQSTSFN